MKKIIKKILSKYDSFWTPIAIAGLGLLLYALRFFENPIRENVKHLSAIATALFVIAIILLILGVTVNWTKTDYRAHDASLQDVDESENRGKE